MNWLFTDWTPDTAPVVVILALVVLPLLADLL